MSNYLMVQKEIKTNPYIGIPRSAGRPSLKKERKWLNELINEIKKGDAAVCVAEVNGHVVGMCDITLAGKSPEAKHVGSLGILVRKGYRSMGVGTQLIEGSLKKARKRFKVVKLDVFGFNKRAQKLYKRFGFKVYGVLPGAFLRGKKLKIDNIMMYLKFD